MSGRMSCKTVRLACKYQEFRISYLDDAIRGNTDSKLEYINKSDVKTGKLDIHIEEDVLYKFFSFDKDKKVAYLQLVQPGDYKIREVFCKLLMTRTNKLIPSDREGFKKHLELVDILFFLGKTVMECLEKSNERKQKESKRYIKEIQSLINDLNKYQKLRDDQNKLFESESYHRDAYGGSLNSTRFRLRGISSNSDRYILGSGCNSNYDNNYTRHRKSFSVELTGKIDRKISIRV